MMNTDLFNKAALLCAGPASGKSTLLSHYEKDVDVRIKDTDEVIKGAFPRYFIEKWYRRPASLLRDAMIEQRDVAVANALLSDPESDHLILSNLWSPTFLTKLIGPNAQPRLYIGRANHERVSELCSLRGEPMSAGLCFKWVAAAESYVPRIFDHWVWLPDDVFLLDVVQVAKREWKLTELGKYLLDRNIRAVREMGALKPRNFNEQGGANVL
jgi:hypothetical protein